MKAAILCFMALAGLSLGGCRPESEELPNSDLSGIIVKASNGGTTADGAEEQVVFTGGDILWFNKTTKELRFKDNLSNNPDNNSVLFAASGRKIKFYLNDEYLFSSLVYISGMNPPVGDALIFYYNGTENRFYLTDKYPPSMGESTGSGISPGGELEAEWNRFIGQLKKEGRYKE